MSIDGFRPAHMGSVVSFSLRVVPQSTLRELALKLERVRSRICELIAKTLNLGVVRKRAHGGLRTRCDLSAPTKVVTTLSRAAASFAELIQ